MQAPDIRTDFIMDKLKQVQDQCIQSNVLKKHPLFAASHVCAEFEVEMLSV